ncbi:DUF1553 domain-containing protein [Aureliella helgolandensis]|uniref:Planctomycete cytochrome C n=1 Tax=Aureliella helgolandensis TaxID=2527968 RepID=A0A518G323_9BACT|nr:DUF1553 domain-containing protein [Aureliella helgolandensis]QDV22998.1 Planctomycete cytochrome C [Aureliella helgolandensis]
MSCRLAALLFLCLVPRAFALEPPQLEFFEARIRPVLVEYCYECHNSTDSTEAGLALDYRGGILEGGAGGASVSLESPASSLLLEVMRHDIDGLEMPQGGPKLEPEILADFEKWIGMGLPDPRSEPPSESEMEQSQSWESTLKRRQQWWSFQPIQSIEPPASVVSERAGEVLSHPVDRFIDKKLQQEDLELAPLAEPTVLVRRVYYSLLGLPPTVSETLHWTSRLETTSRSERDAAWEALVQELLERPQFGERWARHWMDWIRYAESHGSEGDPAIDHAWLYRDYLIRALNADVPLDQLLREHLAGDLLAAPRINEELRINESAIGPAHLRMVFHGFAPTDAMEEKVRFTDDQVNVVSKAFLGLTVSCARCHNHKFDPISQADYYAMFGMLGACQPGRTVIDLPEVQQLHSLALQELKTQLRPALAQDWLASLERLPQRLLHDTELLARAEQADSILRPLGQLLKSQDSAAELSEAWQKLAADQATRASAWASTEQAEYLPAWDLAEERDYATWFPKGFGLASSTPATAGEFSVAVDGTQALTGIYPSGVYTHQLSTKHPARLSSPKFSVEDGSELWVYSCGSPNASLRYVVQDYPRNGTVYPVKQLQPQWKWQQFDVGYWSGDQLHIELAAAQDAPLLVKSDDRSWFGVRAAVVRATGQPAPVESAEHWQPIFDVANGAVPTTTAEVARLYCEAIRRALENWNAGSCSEAEALLLDACLREGLLANQLESLPLAEPILLQYRTLENEIPIPTRVPGVDETVAAEQPLFVRGDHKLLGEMVPRRFLEAFDATPYQSRQSGRLEFAEDLLRDDNPLTRRVLVNRIWHHLFGQGIVRTPDNFGRLGDLPSHPQLLDYLALRFDEQGWSAKELIRFIVTSQTWQASSQGTPRASEVDPENRWLSHANVRRLEAEAIRDSILQASGGLDLRMFGEPQSNTLTRRSVYGNVIRNALDPFLRVFDFPEPFSAVGRRDVTNVPAQSLTMLNDPQIDRYATDWAENLLANPELSTLEQRVQQMFLESLNRPASPSEVERLTEYLHNYRGVLEQELRQVAELTLKREQRERELANILQPVRQRLEAELKTARVAEPPLPVPLPIASWQFEQDATDAIGGMDCKLQADAALQDGRLRVQGGGYAVTSTLSQDVSVKTLEAWVQLDRLDQRGGGVMSLQSRNGGVFDAIVFGEQNPREWLAGSNSFSRTQAFAGAVESDAQERPVHVAIVYHADGRIVGYRNGEPYGQPYMSDGPTRFEAGDAVVSFGVRHLPASGNRLLSGAILGANLYDQALSETQIAYTSLAGPWIVTDRQVRQALSESDQALATQLREEIEQLRLSSQALHEKLPQDLDVGMWTALAKTIFTLKEFIYVR